MDDPFVITVDLDTNPPALPITDATEYFTRQPSVNVTFTNRTDDVTQIQWSWDQTWTDVEPVAPTDTVSIPLPAADGQQAPFKSFTLFTYGIGMTTVTQDRLNRFLSRTTPMLQPLVELSSITEIPI